MHLSKSSTNIQKSSFFANKIYTLVENYSYPKRYLSNYLDVYVQNFLIENHISMDLSVERHRITTAAKSLGISDEEFIKELEYMAYFLKDVILNSTLEEEKKELTYYTQLIGKYRHINNYILKFHNSSPSFKTIAQTLSMEYAEILEYLYHQMTTALFQVAEETDTQPMILSKTLPTQKDIKDFQDHLNAMIYFVGDYNPNPLSIKTSLEKYFTVLSSYQIYRESYDKKNQNIKSIVDKRPSVEEIRELFLAFAGVGSNSIYVLDMETYYQVTLDLLDTYRISFRYNHKTRYLTSIFVDGEKWNIDSYELKKNNKQNKGDTTDTNAYENFFLNIFVPQYLDQEATYTTSTEKSEKKYFPDGFTTELSFFQEEVLPRIRILVVSVNAHDIWPEKSELGSRIRIINGNIVTAYTPL